MEEKIWNLLLLERFPKIIEKAYENAEPSQIAKYSLLLARKFNKYYANTKIIVDDSSMNSKLTFALAVSIVLKESLRLLGVQAPERM